MKIWIIELQDGWHCAVPALTAGEAYKIATARLDASKRPLAVVTHEHKPTPGEGFTSAMRRAILIVRRHNAVILEREAATTTLVSA